MRAPKMQQASSLLSKSLTPIIIAMKSEQQLVISTEPLAYSGLQQSRVNTRLSLPSKALTHMAVRKLPPTLLQAKHPHQHLNPNKQRNQLLTRTLSQQSQDYLHSLQLSVR